MARYIHTLRGKPATFDGWQVCYASFYGKPNRSFTSLKEIKENIETTRKNRIDAGFDFNLSDYKWFRYE